tara:strand:+ start:3952 stop:4614 length:663 start_codon:yes stop_codon:yes gene_type:complete
MTLAEDSLMRAVCLLSGTGTNLQVILENIGKGNIPISLSAVISDNPTAKGIEKAKTSGIKTKIIDYELCKGKNIYHEQLKQLVLVENPDLIILAGYMRILSDDFCETFKGKIINIHPSLLPAYKGLNTHQRVIDAGETHHGTTVHFVVPELDGGPSIIQYRIKIHSSDTVYTLKKKVQEGEYQIYSKVLKWFALEQLEMKNNKVVLHGDHLDKPILIEEN